MFLPILIALMVIVAGTGRVSSVTMIWALAKLSKLLSRMDSKASDTPLSLISSVVFPFDQACWMSLLE